LNNTPTHNKVELSLKFGDLDQVIGWCDLNCGVWYIGEFESGGVANGTYEFNFHDDTDAALFILRWL
jgi:hypothetical protein